MKAKYALLLRNPLLFAKITETRLNFLYSTLSIGCLGEVKGMSERVFIVSGRCLDMSGRCLKGV